MTNRREREGVTEAGRGTPTPSVRPRFDHRAIGRRRARTSRLGTPISSDFFRFPVGRDPTGTRRRGPNAAEESPPRRRISILPGRTRQTAEQKFANTAPNSLFSNFFQAEASARAHTHTQTYTTHKYPHTHTIYTHTRISSSRKLRDRRVQSMLGACYVIPFPVRRPSPRVSECDVGTPGRFYGGGRSIVSREERSGIDRAGPEPRDGTEPSPDSESDRRRRNIL